jgi:murein DD-endopeptidase MepM/ murein hydrolase activator NlpD
MISAGKYLLEVSLVVSLILLIYSLVLKRSTFFRMNRIYLVIGLLVSFTLPLITLPVSVAKPAASLSISDLNPVKTEYVPFLIDSKTERASFDLTTSIATIYLLAVAFLGLRFVAGIVRTILMKRHSSKSEIDGVSVYVSEAVPTFSFFNSIFCSRENLNPLIIRHEMVHINERHWVDLMILELACIVLWFNPVMIFYKRAVKIQHEFLADRGSINQSPDTVEAYLQCMVSSAYRSNAIPGTSQFGARSIKTRIIMMTKSKTPFRYALLYLLVIPAMAFLLFAFQDPSLKVHAPAAPVYTLLIQSTPLDAPVDTKKVRRVFQFGEKFNVVTNKMQHHSGIDFVMDEGENVMSTADGIVIDTGSDKIKGNYVVIKHSNEFATQYFHMKSTTVKKGVTVKKGEVIGFIGTTGLSVSNHLHYEVLKNGKSVDPNDYLPKNIDDGC